MNLIEGALRRPVTVIICALAVFFFGLYSYLGMPRQKTPDTEFPGVTVVTTMDGANALVMDNDVADVLENEINGISGVTLLTSRSFPGRTVTIVQFEMTSDINDAASDVRDKVAAAVKNLPEEADTPIVQKLDTDSGAVVQIAVTGNVSKKELTHYADKVLKPRLQSVANVGSIETPGLNEREIRIWVTPDILHARGLVMEDIAEAVRAKHVELPAGSVRENGDSIDVDLRINGEYATVEDLKSLPIVAKDNTVIRLGEIAQVEDGFAEKDTTALLNDDACIIMNIKRQSGANEVALCEDVVKMLETMKKTAPAGIKTRVLYKQSDFVDNSLWGAANDILTAILLCSLLMFVFLQTFRATLVPVIVMSVCLMGSFLLLNRIGVTINGITMMAISLSVGMVVDATTVVLENIHRHMKRGEAAYEAALNGTKEVCFSVIGGVLTTIAVFSPVAYMSGIVGNYFRAFGLTVIATISLSLILAVTLAPFLCANILRNDKPGRWGSFFDSKITALEKAYKDVLKIAVRRKTATLLIALGLFLMGILLMGRIGTTFIPKQDEGYFEISCELPMGSSVEETERTLLNISQKVRENPYVDYTYITIGTNLGSEKNQGTIYVQLIPRSERPVYTEIQNSLRPMLAGYRDVSAGFSSQSNRDVTVTIMGPDVYELMDISQKVMADMRQTGNFTDIDTDVKLNKPELDIILNRGLTDIMNVDIRALSTEFYAIFGGKKIGVFKDGGYRYDIRMMAPGEQRGLNAMDDVYAKTGSGEIIQANGFFTVEEVPSPNLVKRFNRQRSMSISANVTSNYSSGEAMTYIQKRVMDFAPENSGISAMATGRGRHMKKDFQRLGSSLVIAIILVYVIMAIQFESFVNPFVVMFSLPLLTPGAFGLLYLTGCKLDMMAYMAIILLVGLVVNNGIILVDFITQQRQHGMSKEEAAIEAGPLRLRAILITALSTLMGAMPGALGLTEGSELRQSMNVCILGGLFTSTSLTLLVIPVVYLVIDDAKDFCLRQWNRLNKKGDGADA